MRGWPERAPRRGARRGSRRAPWDFTNRCAARPTSTSCRTSRSSVRRDTDGPSPAARRSRTTASWRRGTGTSSRSARRASSCSTGPPGSRRRIPPSAPTPCSIRAACRAAASTSSAGASRSRPRASSTTTRTNATTSRSPSRTRKGIAASGRRSTRHRARPLFRHDTTAASPTGTPSRRSRTRGSRVGWFVSIPEKDVARAVDITPEFAPVLRSLTFRPVPPFP